MQDSNAKIRSVNKTSQWSSFLLPSSYVTWMVNYLYEFDSDIVSRGSARICILVIYNTNTNTNTKYTGMWLSGSTHEKDRVKEVWSEVRTRREHDNPREDRVKEVRSKISVQFKMSVRSKRRVRSKRNVQSDVRMRREYWNKRITVL